MRQWEIKVNGETIDCTKHFEYKTGPLGITASESPSKQIPKILAKHYPHALRPYLEEKKKREEHYNKILNIKPGAEWGKKQ